MYKYLRMIRLVLQSNNMCLLVKLPSVLSYHFIIALYGKPVIRLNSGFGTYWDFTAVQCGGLLNLEVQSPVAATTNIHRSIVSVVVWEHSVGYAKWYCIDGDDIRLCEMYFISTCVTQPNSYVFCRAAKTEGGGVYITCLSFTCTLRWHYGQLIKPIQDQLKQYSWIAETVLRQPLGRSNTGDDEKPPQDAVLLRRQNERWS